MKRLLLPLIAALALPTAVNAEVTNDYLLKITECQNAYREGKFAEMKNKLIAIIPNKIGIEQFFKKFVILFFINKKRV